MYIQFLSQTRLVRHGRIKMKECLDGELCQMDWLRFHDVSVNLRERDSDCLKHKLYNSIVHGHRELLILLVIICLFREKKEKYAITFACRRSDLSPLQGVLFL